MSHIIGVGSLLGVAIWNKAVSGQLHSFKDGFVAFGIGAAAGGLGAATGGLAFAAAGGAAGGIGGFVAGAAGGAAGTAVMMPVRSAGNSLYFGDPFMSLKDYAIGIAGGALTGGIANGSIAALKGNNFWTGKEVQFGRGTFSFNNTPTRPAPEMKLLEAPNAKLDIDQPKVDKIAEKLKQHLIDPKESQEFNAVIEEGNQKLNIRVESHTNVEREFPGMNLNKDDVVRHMNIEYFEKNQAGKWKPKILPGQTKSNIHIFLEKFKK